MSHVRRKSGRRICSSIGLAMVILFGPRAEAYDADTHALITYRAFNESIIANTPPLLAPSLTGLGLNRFDIARPFFPYWQSGNFLGTADSYFDNLALVAPAVYLSTTYYPRYPSPFEQCFMQQLASAGILSGLDPMLDSGGVVSNFPISNWLIRGDIREDDITRFGYKSSPEFCGLPDIDPWGEINRVLNHFYEPRTNLPLNPSVACVVAPNGVCTKSVDWALGTKDAFAQPPVNDPNRRNHFSYADARDNMWLALTGQRMKYTASQPYDGAARESDSIERLYRWATMFRSLGDVVHLLQDGAQPQHVRNDPHGNILTSKEQQAYEGYTNARALQSDCVQGSTDPGCPLNSYVVGFFGKGENPPLPILSTPYYPIPQFSTPIRFFTTRNASDDKNVPPDSRLGMMDYANRGFFTGGTLPTSTAIDLTEPPRTVDEAHGYARATVDCAMSAELTNIHRKITCAHWMHAVPDAFAGTNLDILPGKAGDFSQPPLVQEGAFLQAAQSIAQPFPRYALGLEEFQVQANLNVPRAISYTAGLINFFFPGYSQTQLSAGRLIRRARPSHAASNGQR